MNTRKEDRYYLSDCKAERFIKQIGGFSSPKIFPVSFNQTLYFNNSEHEVPFEVSIKARKYSALSFKETIELDPHEKWIFEIKEDLVLENSRLRQKKREELKLDEILGALKSQSGKLGIHGPLVPYIADSYERKHYVVNGTEDFRITIDDNLKYYFFEGDYGKQIGKEDYSIVEIKVPQNKIDSIEFQNITNLLSEIGAESVVSKKDMAYNALGSYLRKQAKKSVESSDTEIEAKLLLNKDDQQIFHKIKNNFKEGSIKGFKLLPDFLYTLESGKLHQYIINSERYLRISIKGDSKKVVSKENSDIINDPHSLNCIVRRNEIKESLDPILLILPSKTIYRKRKYFLAENKENGNSYCILIDRCTYGANELFQMEIEGLTMSSPYQEKKIIEDVSNITSQLIKRYPMLKPTTLTKLEWLKSI